MGDGLERESKVAEEAQRLAATLTGLSDPAVRLGWMGDCLRRMGAATACDILAVVLERTGQRDPAHSDLLLCVSVYLCSAEGVELRRAVAALADLRGLHALHNLLRDPETPSDETEGAPRVPALKGDRKLSLGERKSLARRRDRNLITRIMRDPHPDVIRILLDNPALTESEVLRLAALRPAMPDVLTQVFQHPRWVLRYPVRLALALNPHTPELIAVQLVPHLTIGDRLEVARSAHVAARVRAACTERPPGAPLH